MTDAEKLVHSIVGVRRADFRPLAYAVEIAQELLFVRGMDMHDISLMEDVYGKVALRTGRNAKSTARRVERLAHMIWEAMTPELIDLFIGRRLPRLDSPGDIIYYLAYYLQYGKPFFEITFSNPILMR